MDAVYAHQRDCCGCTACESACPKRAIVMAADDEGFLYPQIDGALCVDCGACRRVCPFLREDNGKHAAQPQCFAVCHTDDAVLYRSTSGGAFTALSDAMLDAGGVVYGADFDEHFHIHHTRAADRTARDRQRVSKYAQSDLRGVYAAVARDLSEDRRVLFTGTPCQIAGLSGYLGKRADHDGLILCDLICHSVPSPLIWDEFRALLEREHNAPVTEVFFRTKRHGWSRAGSNRGFSYRVAGDETLYEDDRFYQLFFGELCMMRPSCARCPYTEPRRTGDLTIADYWGIEKYSDEWGGGKGVSLVLVSTERGAALFQAAKGSLRVQQRDIREQLAEQGRLNAPIAFPESRKDFWALYKREGFDGVAAFLQKKYQKS